MSRASDTAYQWIRERIISGSLPPATQLKEVELARLCGVSRTPVRDALRRLEAELLVRRTETQRTFVRPRSGTELADSFHLRAWLEAEAAARAASKITGQQVDQLRRLNERAERAIHSADGVDRETCLAANFEFHTIIVQASDSQRLMDLHKQLIRQAMPALGPQQDEKSEILRGLSDHQQLVRAFISHDAQWARSLMDSHIRQSFHLAQMEMEIAPRPS